MPIPPFIEQLFSPLAAVVPAVPAQIRGEWSMSRRRVYENESQLGSGSGPFVEVVDARWRGVVEASVPLAGLALRCTADGTDWAKSRPAVSNPALEFSLTREYGSSGRATFGMSFAAAFLPAGPVDCGEELTLACSLGSGSAETGRLYLAAEAEGTAFAVVFLQRSVLKVGRNRLWHLREPLATSLPDALRELLLHRRSGTIRPG